MNHDWLLFFADIEGEKLGLDEAGKCQYVQNLLVCALNLPFEWRRHDVWQVEVLWERRKRKSEVLNESR
jgi:hypothetical protein